MYKEEYLKHVRKEILEQINKYEKEGKRFNKEDLPEKMNSYERNLYLPLLSNEALIEKTEYCISNTWGDFRKSYKYDIKSVTTYNDILKHKLIHLLIERLKEVLES